MKSFSSSRLALLLALTGATANAHPGHGPMEAPLTHIILSPEHLGVALATGVVLFCILHAWPRRRLGNRTRS